MLGRDGLLDVARSLDRSPPRRLVPDLLGAVAGRAGAEFADDVTVLAFAANGHRRRIPLHDLLLAPVRYLRALPGTLFA
jgi:hypothetical protein